MRAKQYSAHGRAGCVQLRKARRTGTTVGVYHTEQAAMGGEKWSIVCEDHGFIISIDTLSLARDHATEPDQWCEDCQAHAGTRRQNHE